MNHCLLSHFIAFWGGSALQCWCTGSKAIVLQGRSKLLCQAAKANWVYFLVFCCSFCSSATFILFTQARNCLLTQTQDILFLSISSHKSLWRWAKSLEAFSFEKPHHIKSGDMTYSSASAIHKGKRSECKECRQFSYSTREPFGKGEHSPSTISWPRPSSLAFSTTEPPSPLDEIHQHDWTALCPLACHQASVNRWKGKSTPLLHDHQGNGRRMH